MLLSDKMESDFELDGFLTSTQKSSKTEEESSQNLNAQSSYYSEHSSIDTSVDSIFSDNKRLKLSGNEPQCPPTPKGTVIYPNTNVGFESFDNSVYETAFKEVTIDQFNNFDVATRAHIAHIVGASIHEDLKSIAQKNMYKSSRNLDKINMTNLEILKSYDCEILIQFIEGATQKYPRANDNDLSDENVASLQNATIENILKCINSKTIGISTLKQNLTLACDSSSAALAPLNPGGGRKVIKTLPIGENLSVRTGSGLLAADNAQRGVGKLQKHSRLKLYRPETPVYVGTHLVIYENCDDPNSELFKNEGIQPSQNDWHPLFRYKVFSLFSTVF